jgi:antitoxin (DNA-binding transcriptional repressor) of toxin-antitoxin stability system
MRDRQGAQVDLARLPDEVAQLIAALAPGGSLVITRGGEPVATITAAGSALLEGVVISGSGGAAGDSGGSGGSGSDSGPGVTVVATTMKLSDSARTKLSDELGTDYIVLDMHSAPSTADVLLVPPISPQLLGNLREMFPSARVVVAELDDPELGVSYRGPVRRMIDSGAELYLASTTVPHLARQLVEAVSARGLLEAGRRPRVELE